MKIDLITVGTKPPAWVQSGFNEYCKRMPKEYQLRLHEVPTLKRSKTCSVAQLVEKEGRQILERLSDRVIGIALDVKGDPWSTSDLAKKLENWSLRSENVAFMVGGPDGLSRACHQKASLCWSLSALTFPHFLIRVLIAEQIYRSWSLLNNHPYHR